MSCTHGVDRYPKHRLIVFAAAGQIAFRDEALFNRRVEASMTSFHFVQSSTHWKRIGRDQMHRWPHYRYLDSGAFTFLRRAEGSRTGNSSQPTQQAAKAKEKDAIIDESEFLPFYQKYAAYLRDHLDDWDYVFELDVDTTMLRRRDGSLIDGVTVSRRARAKLRDIAGDKLIPVWHPTIDPHPPYPEFQKLIDDGYGYIGIGSDVSPNDRSLRYVIDMAHHAGVLVHGLGATRVETLERTPFDTVDSTTWLSSVRFGQFAGTVYSTRQNMSPAALAKLRHFEALVRKLGYDPEALLTDGCTQTEKYEVAVALMQKRQSAVSAVPPPIMMEALLP